MEVLCQKSVCIFSLSLSLTLSSVTWGSLSTSRNKVITIGAPVGPNSTAFPAVPLKSIKGIGLYLYERLPAFHVTEDPLKLWTIPRLASRADHLGF